MWHSAGFVVSRGFVLVGGGFSFLSGGFAAVVGSVADRGPGELVYYFTLLPLAMTSTVLYQLVSR